MASRWTAALRDRPVCRWGPLQRAPQHELRTATLKDSVYHVLSIQKGVHVRVVAHRLITAGRARWVGLGQWHAGEVGRRWVPAVVVGVQVERTVVWPRSRGRWCWQRSRAAAGCKVSIGGRRGGKGVLLTLLCLVQRPWRDRSLPEAAQTGSLQHCGPAPAIGTSIERGRAKLCSNRRPENQ